MGKYAYLVIIPMMLLYVALTCGLGSFWALYARAFVITSPEFINVLFGTIFVLAPYWVLGFLLAFLCQAVIETEQQLRLRRILGICSLIFAILTVLSLMRFADQTNALYDPTRVINSSGMGWETTSAQQFVAAWFTGLFSGLTTFFVTLFSYSFRSRVYSSPTS